MYFQCSACIFSPHQVRHVPKTLGIERGGIRRFYDGQQRCTHPELSGNAAVSPAVKSKVRALALPMKTVARAWPLWKYCQSGAYRLWALFVCLPWCVLGYGVIFGGE